MSKPFLKKFTCISLIIVIFLGLFLVNVGEARAWSNLTKTFLRLGLALITQNYGAAGQAAVDMGEATIGWLAKQIIEGMVYLASIAAHWFLGVCANLFTEALDFGTKIVSHNEVYTGWKITRDFVNMFFILALVIIAFATILRIETYGMKALLPKLIIIALLINFSYLVCGIIIDASNVTANFFVEGIKKSPNFENIAKIGTGGLAASVIIQENKGGSSENKTQEAATFYNLMVANLMHALSEFLAGFVLLLGVILIFIRTAALWLLIVFAPFAWFFGIFPALKHMASKWWDNFLKYAFFLPIYVFIIYLAMTLINNFSMNVVSGVDAPKSFLSSVAILSQFILALVIFGAAPMVAMTMGVHSSQAVTGFAKGVFKGTAKGIGRWTGRKTEVGARRAFKPEKLTGFFAKYHKIPGFKALGRQAAKWAARGTTRINETAKKLPTLSEEETAKRVKLATDPYQKMAWVQKLSEIAETPANISLVKNNLKKYEAMGGNVVRDVIANDLTLARTDAERATAATIRKSTGKITLKESEAKDIKSIEAMRTVFGTDEFTKAVNKMPEAIKDAVGNTLIEAANKSVTPMVGTALEQRKVFAKITGRIAEAFMDSKKHLYNKQFNDYVRKMKPEDFAKIKGDINLRITANSIDTSTALNVRKYLPKEIAEMMGRNFTPGVKKALRQSPAWASYIPKPKT